MKRVLAITHDFHVSAMSRYIPERSNQDVPVFFFSYWVSITNKGHKTAQLLNRYWHITDADGRINEVNGEGIVGTYVHEVAEQKGIETTLLARQEGFPLQVKVKKNGMK